MVGPWLTLTGLGEALGELSYISLARAGSLSAARPSSSGSAFRAVDAVRLEEETELDATLEAGRVDFCGAPVPYAFPLLLLTGRAAGERGSAAEEGCCCCSGVAGRDALLVEVARL